MQARRLVCRLGKCSLPGECEATEADSGKHGTGDLHSAFRSGRRSVPDMEVENPRVNIMLRYVLGDAGHMVSGYLPTQIGGKSFKSKNTFF